MKESVLQAKILEDLKKRGHFAVKVIAGNRAGIPDILACVNGRFVAFEAKSDTGKPTALQLVNIEKIIKSGGRAKVVNSMEEYLEVIGN